MAEPEVSPDEKQVRFELTQSMQAVIVATIAWLLWLALALYAAFALGALLTKFTLAFGMGAEFFAALPEIIRSPLHPMEGAPPDLAAAFPPSLVFWGLVAFFIAVGIRVIHRLQLRFVQWQRRGNAGETRWADKADLDPIRVYRGGKIFARIPVLRRLPGVIPPTRGVELARLDKPLIRPMLAVENQQSHTLVVAGTRSGKTAGLCIPALLTFNGCVIATSVKNDLIDQTIERRRRMGRVFVFDPVQATEYESSGWSPLVSSRDWRSAQRTAASLIDVAISSEGSSGNMQFFSRMAQQTLPCMLFAAAISKGNMRNVVRWLHRINDKATQGEITTILKYAKNSQAIDAWKGFVTKEPKMRGDIAATIASALISYEDERVQKNAETTDLFPEEFFNGEANTLYVVAPMAEQSRLEPVFVALMQSFLLWVTEQPAPLDTPCLCVLDEAANIAALPLLPELLSTIGGQKVQVLTAWQDFSQIHARYGDKKNTILNNSRAKLVLPGVSDPETIRYFSDVAGEASEEEFHSTDPTKRKGSSYGRRSILNAAVIREQRFGRGILVYGHLPPARVRLRLYFRDKELKRLAAGKAPRTSPLESLLGRIPRRTGADDEPRLELTREELTQRVVDEEPVDVPQVTTPSRTEPDQPAPSIPPAAAERMRRQRPAPDVATSLLEDEVPAARAPHLRRPGT